MQLSKYKEIEQSLFHIKQETEDVLYSFIEEWKEENEQFLNKLSKNSNTNKDALKSTLSNGSTINDLKRIDILEQESEIDYKDLLKGNLQNEKIDSKQNPIFIGDKTNLKVVKNSLNPFWDEILSLKNNGHSIDEIAKKLDKGKTEIELMLKLRQ